MKLKNLSLDTYLDHTEKTVIKYLFWIFILTYGEPGLLEVLIGLVQSWV